MVIFSNSTQLSFFLYSIDFSGIAEDTKNFSCDNDNILSFDDQLKIFLNKILLEETEIDMNYKAVCNELLEIFKPIFLKCKVTNFGSTAIGLGFKNCDLDIYLDIGILFFWSSSIC